MMYYFKFNIGDYHKKAGRLSMLEHGAYTLLIHSCYDRERFPTEEEALDWCWARTDEEIQAVKFVLRKFFEVKEGRYVQARIQDEIDAYHGRQETNRAIALEREARKRTKRAEESTKRERSVQDRTPNQEPRTNNQEPKRGRFAPPSVTEVAEYIREKNYSVDAQQFVDFYSAKGWMVGSNKMKDWKASVRTWVNRDRNTNQKTAITEVWKNAI
jgi:uncharacterized protein YdaU (DUF1376 family)